MGRRGSGDAGADGRAGQTLFAIQYLRGGAALAVCAYHALQWCDGGFDVGRAGVDVFFVISGVIMWRITSGAPPRAVAFLWRRFTRVAPLYWAATLLVAAIAEVWPAFLPEVRPGLGHLVLSLAFIPHLDPRGLPFPTLPPGWTLDYEMIFYLVVGASLALGLRRARLVCGALFVIVVLGFLFPDSAYFLGANPMLLQFAAGVGLAEAGARGLLPRRPVGFGLLAGGLLLFAMVQLGGLFSELWRPLVWGVPATLLVAGALAIELDGPRPPLERVAFVRNQPGALQRAQEPKDRARFSVFADSTKTHRALGGPLHRALMKLGDASFALYLFHLPATAVIAHTLGYRHEVAFLVASMGVSVAAGLAVHAWIERPLLAWLRRGALSPGP
jgi:exopolysaccharide production protein ExoZ